MALTPAGRGIEVFAVYLLFLALTTISVALRVYCRAHIQKAFGTDDYFAVLAWVSHLLVERRCRRLTTDICKVLFVLHAAFAITGVHHGTGQHAWDIQPPAEIPIGLKVSRHVNSIQQEHHTDRCRTGGSASRSTCSLTWPSKQALLSCCFD